MSDLDFHFTPPWKQRECALIRTPFMAEWELVADDENTPNTDVASPQFAACDARNCTGFLESRWIHLQASLATPEPRAAPGHSFRNRQSPFPSRSPQNISPGDPAAAGPLEPTKQTSWMAMGMVRPRQQSEQTKQQIESSKETTK
jgi:hypothetical protein